jgi:hypothetical protein
VSLLLAPAAAHAAPAAPPAPVPADLQRLEHAMLTLPLTGVHFTASIGVSASGSGTLAGPLGSFGGLARVRAHGAASESIISFTGEESFSPLAAQIQGSFLGLKIEVRLIGTTLYTYEPFIAEEDGGRPWVEKPGQRLEHALGVELGSLGASAGSAATQAFGGVVQELTRAISVRELGPRTIDGQATTGFDAIVDPTTIGEPSKRQVRTLRKTFARRADLEVFIAEDGLPVRVLERVPVHERRHRHHVELLVQEDNATLAAPVAVTPPPPRQTITAVALAHLEAEQLAKLLARLRRHHRHR